MIYGLRDAACVREETGGCVFSFRNCYKSSPYWPRSNMFHSFPDSSALGPALMDSTCTFQIVWAWNRAGGVTGGQSDLTLAWELFECFWVMKTDWKRGNPNYQRLGSQLWFHSREMQAMWAAFSSFSLLSLTPFFTYFSPCSWIWNQTSTDYKNDGMIISSPKNTSRKWGLAEWRNN